MKKNLILKIISMLLILNCSSATLAHENYKNEKEYKITNSISYIAKILSNDFCKKDTDCEYMEIGNKACGGPLGYIVYSKLNTEKYNLKTAVENYNKLTKQTDNNNFSICDYASPPKEIKCLNFKCTTSSKYLYKVQ